MGNQTNAEDALIISLFLNSMAAEIELSDEVVKTLLSKHWVSVCRDADKGTWTFTLKERE